MKKKVYKQYHLNDLKEHARKRGGKCNSNTYHGVDSKYEWECSNGHTWKTSWDSVNRIGTWCRKCHIDKLQKENSKTLFKLAQEIAKKRKGKLLSLDDGKITKKMRLEWSCNIDHIWKSSLQNIEGGNWCQICANRKTAKMRMQVSIKKAHEIIKEKGGVVISGQFTHSKNDKVEIMCKLKHKWETNAMNIISGSWCGKCSAREANKDRSLSIDEMNAIAKARGGKCLSTKYVNSQTKLEWECFHGHKWAAIPNAIKRGGWCPDCRSGLSERICRAYIEHLTGKKFPQTWPIWLRVYEDTHLQLDGYNEELGIAFEHHGMQHYKFIKRFHKDLAGFHDQQFRDLVKESACDFFGVKLIIIPSINKKLKLIDLKSFLIDKLNEFGLKVSQKKISSDVKLLTAYSSNKFTELITFVEKYHSGKVLSDTYLGAKRKLSFQCTEGHIWEATPDNILNNNNWCPYCSGRKFDHDEAFKIQEIARREHEGVIENFEYENTYQEIFAICKNGHRFKTNPKSVKKGIWCRECNVGKQYDVKFCQDLAKSFRGEFLSESYSNRQRTLYEWKCRKGHKWKSTLDRVLRGVWCDECKAGKKYDVIMKFAEKNSASLKTKKPVNYNKKLHWRCENGHNILASFNVLKRRLNEHGYICFECNKLDKQKRSLEKCINYAKSKSGDCLSRKYINSKTKLKWKCREGHVWNAIPDSVVRRKTWCPKCKNK